MMDAGFLRPEVKLEPLVCGWYCWTHLVSPAQHAMNVVNRHIPLLQSYIRNPSVHIAASNDPTLFGGPFVNLPLDRLADVEKLLARTEAQCTKLIALGGDLKQLDRDLQECVRGFSLNEFYSRIPDSLHGLVEFLYDLNNQPRLRLYEELLYDENPGAGSEEIMLSLVRDEDRSFFMSTPRLASADSMTFTIPFADRRLDLLSSMRTKAMPIEPVAEALEVRDLNAFAKFFTTCAPHRRSPQYVGDGVRVRYFGHACVLIQTKDVAILMDPLLAWDSNDKDDRFTFCDLPDRIDLVVLSHNHQDHCSPESLLQLRHRIGRIVVPANNAGALVDPSMKLALRKLGFTSIDVMHAFDTIELPEGKITSLPFPGEHVDLDIYSRHGILMEIKGRRFGFLVDSDGCDSRLFRRIVKRTGRKLDALFIGMECHGAPLSWLYGPLLTKAISRKNDESRRLSGLDSSRAWNVVSEFDPMHVFIYAMGQEPWIRYIMGLEYTPDSIQLREVATFLDRCRESNITAENLYIKREMAF